MRKIIILSLFVLIVFLSGCQQAQLPQEQEKTQLANPASVNCIEKGGKIEIQTSADGSQQGICTLSDGTKCDEWAYYREECPEKEEANISDIKNETAEINVSIHEKQNTTLTDAPVTSEKSKEKFLVYFPWTKGESWTMTTDFHDENCLDFVNFKNNDAAVVAAADGEVLLSKHSFPSDFYIYGEESSTNPDEMGNFVILEHNSNTYTVHMHLQHEDIPPVEIGDSVKAGKRIGYVGSTGFNYHPPKENHIHFCVVDVSIFPTPSFVTKPLDRWGFHEMNGSNKLILNKEYKSQNPGK